MHVRELSRACVRNIMIANPYSSRNEETSTCSTIIAPPLSQQTINDILQQRATFSTYDLLLANIAEVQSNSEAASWAILEYYKTDTTADHTDSYHI